MTSVQKEIASWIEQGFYQLVKNAEVANFEKTIQSAIDDKREKNVEDLQFLDALMLNLSYYERNATVWQELFHSVLTAQTPFEGTVLETELLTGQMVARYEVDEQREHLCELFHEAYEKDKLTADIIIYDYAFSSIAHALRVDFLTLCAMQEHRTQLLRGDVKETLRVIDGYVHYYADQFTRQLSLH